MSAQVVQAVGEEIEEGEGSGAAFEAGREGWIHDEVAGNAPRLAEAVGEALVPEVRGLVAEGQAAGARPPPRKGIPVQFAKGRHPRRSDPAQLSVQNRSQ